MADLGIPDKKSQAIYTVFDRYLRAGDSSLIDKFTIEELEFAITQCYRDDGRPPHTAMLSRLNQLKEGKKKLEEGRLKAIEETRENHKHYRGIGIGYTATVLTLSLFQVNYLYSQLKPEVQLHYIAVIACIASLVALIGTVLICVMSQYLIFRGYLAEARSDFHHAINRYFSPADELIKHSIITFLFGTALTLILTLQWISSIIITPFIYIWFMRFRKISKS